jgi:DNA-binding transcriptional regulator LsrR (DeoR family)
MPDYRAFDRLGVERLAAAIRRADVPASRLDQAARAAWLYYVAGRTQDEIAAQMALSRQATQRLVSLAVAEKLIKFRIDHPIAACMALGEALIDRFRLRFCEVVPSDPASPSALPALAAAGAAYLERALAQRVPLVLGLSTGTTLRAVSDQVATMNVPHHKVVSLCGTMGMDGRAGSPEPVVRVAERTGAQCYPMPAPVIAATRQERELFQAQRPFLALKALLAEARFALVGVGEIGWECPLHQSGFVTDQELSALMAAGAVGEIAGWSFDQGGQAVESPISERVNGLLPWGSCDLVIGAAAGPRKVAALRAALGRLLQGLFTDERTASALLDQA